MPAALVAISLVGFTIFYFARVFTLATRVFFWNDELFSVYLCRLPTLSRVLKAVRAGVDFNQPLFYVLTRASNTLFGEGLIATRFPGILGFWISCLSLFCFVNHRVGPRGGLVAMALPLTTGAFYTACQARSYGIVLGFSGLALVSWQMSMEQPLPNYWLLAFSLFLMAAFMAHCYALLIAIPFALAEMFGVFWFKQVNWLMWIAIITPALAACLSFVPSLRAYRRLTKDTVFPSLFPARLSETGKAYAFLFGRCIPMLSVVIVLFALDSPARALVRSQAPEVIWREMILAVSFLAVPIFAVALGKIAGGPFLPRYCISAIFGFSVVVGTGVGMRDIPTWFALALTVVALAYAINAGVSGPTHYTGENPLVMHSLLRGNYTKSLPIVVLHPHEFLYLSHYAPDLVPRLYYVSLSEGDINRRGLENLSEWCFVKYNRTLTMDQFSRLNIDFLVYGPGAWLIRPLSLAVASGWKVRSLRERQGHFLAEVEVGKSRGFGGNLRVNI